jgi:hypothetical protein
MKTFACLALAVTASLPAAAERITAIAGCVKAMGGQKALGRIQAETLIGNVIDEESGKSRSYSLILKSPDRFYSEIVMEPQRKIVAISQ